MIPGLTVWRIDQARKHAKNEGAGKQVNIPTLYRTRLDHFKVEHFLDFISSPIYHQDVAFGTKKVKLTNETIEIPNMVRTVISSRIVSLYQSYCQENNFEPLGKSTLFAILKVGYYYRSDYRSFDIIMLIFFMISFQACPASKKKSLSGLDNVATEGSLAFDALQNILEILGQKGIHTIIKITPLSKVYFLIILHCDLQVHPLTGSQTQEAGCTVARIIWRPISNYMSEMEADAVIIVRFTLCPRRITVSKPRAVMATMHGSIDASPWRKRSRKLNLRFLSFIWGIAYIHMQWDAVCLYLYAYQFCHL